MACDRPDGAVAMGGDCDDNNAAVNPHADEICDGVDDDCDGLVDPDTSLDATDWVPDADGDGYGREDATPVRSCVAPAGYTADATDCADALAAIHPGAEEVCDGADNDCDGATDPATSTDAGRWHLDMDGDGYGDPDTSRMACDQPGGYVADDTDCNDSDALVSPGAPEICNGRDDDCDGVSDPSSSVDAPTFYFDADHDGFGDPEASVTVCSGPAGYLGDGTDCDDTNPTINPDATERCDPADADEDCDGLADDADPSVTGQTEWTIDADSDGYGDETASPIAACDPPAGYADNALDCDDTDPLRSPARWPCTADLTTSDATSELKGAKSSEYAGYSLWGGDDYNLDGTPDFLVGAYYGGGGKGTVYVVFGPLDPAASLSTADLSLSDSALTFVGYWTGPAGDLDGDGNADLALLASKGGYYGFYAPIATGETLSTADVHLSGEVSTDYLTTAAGAFDRDGDGADDVAVADGNWPGTGYTGAVYVMDGPVSGSASLSTADLILRGEASGDDAGGYRGLSPGGDVDGDGLDELFVGANYNGDGGSYSGAAYVVSGGSSGVVSLSDADAVISGTGANQLVGEAVAGEGDVDGDGYDDMLIGSARYGSSYQGNVWLMSGPISGDTSVAAATASLPGVLPYDDVGGTLGSLRDLDGDGLGDLVVGALLDYSCGKATGTGSVYVIYGPVSGSLACARSDVILAGTTVNGRLSTGIASIGDVDGDGLGDLFVGAYLEGNGDA